MPFALDFLGWKCLSRQWAGDTPRFGNGCDDKPSEFLCNPPLYYTLIHNADKAYFITPIHVWGYNHKLLLMCLSPQSTEGGGGGESLQLLPPELLQLCIQQLAQQALSTSAEGGLGEEESGISGNDSNDSSGTVGLLQQVRHMNTGRE